MVTVSLPLDDARFHALTARAAREGKPVESLLLDAVDNVLDDEASYLAAVKKVSPTLMPATSSMAMLSSARCAP